MVETARHATDELRDDVNQGGGSDDSGSSLIDNISHLANLDEQKGRAAGALRDMASTLRERAGAAPFSGADAAGQAAARPLESGAAYIEQHTPGDMWSDLMAFCRDHPAAALFIGFGAGYLFKKLFR